MNSFSQLNLQIPDLWEVRDVINKVKNVVLNYTEMEAKVHEATNNEAWGASSTLMQEIAQATFNYQYFNEIMPTIYKRFTEKEARQWRQIYKSLVLLEYLIKNGSERVVDDARSHISMIKMMKNFHFVDEKGKDQGINVRNRAKELADLLNDVDKIKMERKKAKKNRNKYTGVGSDGSAMFHSNGSYIGDGGGYSGGGGSRYEGFGSDSFSGGGNDYSSGGGATDFYDDERPGRYDTPSSPPTRRSLSLSPEPKKKETAKVTARDLFDFDDEPATTSTSSFGKTNKQTNEDDWGDFATGDGNDDFDDFQSAPQPPPAQTGSSTKKSNDIFDLLGDDTFTSTTTPTPAPQQPNLMLAQPMSFDTLVSNQNTTTTTPPIQPHNTPAAQTPQKTNTELPGGIWSQASNLISLDSLGAKNSSPVKTTNAGPSMNSLKNNSVNAGWNNWANANATPQQPPKQSNNAFDDLLF
ncbi:ENTH-domain-containing protein [Backusella circina FSU 941]|nr:ENTH-domain-containing protein [Backusella circina FSU 941]